MTNKTLELDKAAAFLNMHKETLRLKAKRGEIPGRKPGKRWIFSQVALEKYLAGEWYPRIVEGRKENHECHSTSEVIKVQTGSISYPTPEAGSQYREALEPRTRRKPRNFTTA